MMKGRNTLLINHDTMLEAVNTWLETKVLHHRAIDVLKATHVAPKVNGPNFDFEIDLKEVEAPKKENQS